MGELDESLFVILILFGVRVSLLDTVVLDKEKGNSGGVQWHFLKVNQG